MKKTIAVNRSAGFEYFIEEKFEAGIVLEGAEVKSLRKGSCSLKDSFCFLHGGELFIKNMHIALYDKAGSFNSRDSKRDRKLLLHKYETAKIAGKVNEKGMTLIPLSIYFSGSLVKMEIALCKGKQTYDKRRSIAEKDRERDMQREIKNYT
ncbi:MAG: SsrA-binding protein SmpB [Clostridia bacterium]|nr:SsrA-binding protein SmpB [Clostridia bacterium]